MSVHNGKCRKNFIKFFIIVRRFKDAHGLSWTLGRSFIDGRLDTRTLMDANGRSWTLTKFGHVTHSGPVFQKKLQKLIFLDPGHIFLFPIQGKGKIARGIRICLSVQIRIICTFRKRMSNLVDFCWFKNHIRSYG
jgi:hypothetical protein